MGLPESKKRTGDSMCRSRRSSVRLVSVLLSEGKAGTDGTLRAAPWRGSGSEGLLDAMFSREGSARSDAQNRWLAGCLAFVGGFVNSCGFVLVGAFTSHVTGYVGRLANDAATGQYAAAFAALTLVLCFFVGALVASMIVESRFWGTATARAYALALAVEAVLLGGFTLLSYATKSDHPRVQDAEAAVLCAAMGLQNALVSRLSGAVVRTTHLTGVVTDLGIEGARWFRFWRRTLSDATRLPFVLGRNRAERPALPKALLLLTIAASFLFGAAAGALAAIRWHHASVLLAAAIIAACATYAARSPAKIEGPQRHLKARLRRSPSPRPASARR